MAAGKVLGEETPANNASKLDTATDDTNEELVE